MNRRLIFFVVGVLVALILAGIVLAVIAAVTVPAGSNEFWNEFLNRQVIITIAAVMAYIVWMIVFFLVIERWLCRLTGSLVGVTIKREFSRYQAQNFSVLDALFMSSWTVVGPASLSLRLVVGLLRVSFTLLALTLPIALGLFLYFGFIAKSMK